MIERAVHLPPRGRRQAALVERFRGGVRALAGKFGQDLAELLRAGVGLLAYGLDALLPHLGGERLRTVRIAQLHAARLGGRECRLGALRDLGALLFGDGRIDVQHERVGVRDLGNDERHALRHQAGDERDVARQAVELGHDNRASVERRPLQRRLELRPPVECIGTLGGLDLGEGLGDLVAFGRTETLDRGLLALKAETGLPLFLGRNPDVGDNGLAHANLNNERFAVLWIALEHSSSLAAPPHMPNLKPHMPKLT